MANLLKLVLSNIPTAAIVVDGGYRVRYANKAFLDYFSVSSKGKGSFRDVIGCREDVKTCGSGIRCAYCSIRNVFQDAITGNGLAFRNIIVKGGKKNIGLRIKVKKTGKYYIGTVDNAYELEIAKEMHSAQDIQQRLLPPAKSGGSVPYSFMYLPCREIGGDLPDVYDCDGDTCGLLADVSGKGISAGMLSAFVKAGWDRKQPSPAKAISGLCAKFCELNLDETNYITVAAVRLDKEHREIRYCLAGHNAPMLVKSKAGVDEITMNSPPVSDWLGVYPYEDHLIGYREGDILVLITDGVTESKNEAGEQFSLERVKSILARSTGAEHFIERLKAALSAFCGSFSDDLTAIAFDLS